ncbi:MAG: peptidoglycan DD-metalloendopeptidase family protein [bacterium]
MKKNGLILFIIIIFCFTYPVFAFSLEYGDKGSEISKIQSYLYEMGYDIGIDGIFGYTTKEVVKDFQYSNGLKVDGIVGEQTFKLMEKVIKDIKYVVQSGDTLSGIADDYNTTVKSIKKLNSLKSNSINIGQELSIPKTGVGGGDDRNVYSTIYHEVHAGDVLSLIARRYGVDTETIKLANNIKNNVIYVGETLAIPHIKRDVNQPFTLTKGAFIWPVLGRISSSYGYRIHPIRKERHFHGGIDISVPIGTEIRAAASGKVIQSGYINGFGKTVVIDHGDNIKSLYAHNSKLLITAGADVGLGQVIALAGSTGVSTGSHLDFRIYYKEETVNPIKYLP